MLSRFKGEETTSHLTLWLFLKTALLNRVTFQINSEVKSIGYNRILKDMWLKVIRSNHCDVLIQCSTYKVSLRQFY